MFHLPLLPLGVARHLNQNGWYPEHSFQVDENGNSIAKVSKKIHRFGFQSLEFTDIQDLSPASQIVLATPM